MKNDLYITLGKPREIVGTVGRQCVCMSAGLLSCH